MVLKIKESYLEYIFLIAFISIFLWIGAANLFDHRLNHEQPYGYFASDAFLHQTTAQSTKHMGNYQNVAYYKAAGFEDVIGYDPPLSGHLSSLLSHLSGLEVYDTIYFLVFFSITLSAVILYLIIRRFNRHIALLSLPFSLLIFTNKFYSGITWGQWDMYYATLFLVAAIWAIDHLKTKNTWFLLSIFLSAAFLAHAVEAIWAVGFIIFYFLLKIIFKKISFKELKTFFKSGLLAAILSSYFLIIFIFVWLPGRQSRLFKLTAITSIKKYPLIFLSDFGLLLIPLAIGLIISLFLLRKKKFLVPATSIYMFLIGFTYLIGFDKATQTRFIWPLYLSIFFGTCLYFIFKTFVKDWKLAYSFLIGLLLLFAFPFSYYEKINSPGIMDLHHWEGLTWIKDHTPEKASIYYFYADYNSQNSLFANTQRVPVFVNTEDYTATLQQQTIKRGYQSVIARGHLRYWKDFPSVGNYEEEKGTLYFEGPKDICNFDYFVFDINPQASQNPTLIQYNIILRKNLLENKNNEEVYNNQIVSILKNNQPGADCLTWKNV